MPATGTVPVEFLASIPVMVRVGLSISLADVRHDGTAEPDRVHGQRPWFQSVMINVEHAMKNVKPVELLQRVLSIFHSSLPV